MKKRSALFALAVVLISATALADEGMWLYNAFPAGRVKAKYKFLPSQQFLDHLRKASVKAGGASGSFVSADGLVFTNHHVAATCVHNISTSLHDYMKEGFYAPTREQEPKCPGLELQNLLEVRDVTNEVESAVKPGMSDAEAGAAQRSLIEKLARDCTSEARHERCEVVTLYSGGLYHLYKYHRYTDVRLVMAPEFNAAFFGGDPDNFTYPRYDLDITFLRVYENDAPVHVDDYLQWSNSGVKDGELVFVSGHPGTTGRLLTMSQLEYTRDVAYPARLKMLKSTIDALQAFSAKSEENARVAERILFAAQNSYKAVTGYQSGLQDKKVMAQKAEAERKLREAVNKDPKMATEYGGAWDAVAQAIEWQRANFATVTYKAETAIPGRLASIARTLVRAAEERKKPDEKRPLAYQEKNLPALERSLFASIPYSVELEVLQITEGLKAISENLPSSDLYVKAALAGKSPEERAKELVYGSHLGDLAFRKEIYGGGQVAIEATADPMIQLMRQIDPETVKVRREYDDHVDAVVRKNGALIAKARFKIYGTEVPPDATGTLRLSYGQVKGYSENGKKIPYFTTYAGAFQHEAAHDGKAPYKLPESYHRAKDKLNLNTPLDTVNTADIIGGNSGSPAVNTEGDVVGILFDGNMQSLPWNYFYDDAQGRAVLTDSRGVIEALRKIYNANPLADELLGARRFVPSLQAPAKIGK
ncbi:MAG TPA: S46 family peptidase [Candidatus Acidoferrales bacterium]|nr:S46 family peptidase [Candidatus Acidoferrales bacterium]